MSRYEILYAMRKAMETVINNSTSSETAIGYIHYCEDFIDDTISFLAKMFFIKPNFRDRLIERINDELNDEIGS